MTGKITLSHFCAFIVNLLLAGVSISPVIIDRCVWMAMLLWQQVFMKVWGMLSIISFLLQSTSVQESLVAGTSLTKIECQYLKKSTLKLADDGIM